MRQEQKQLFTIDEFEDAERFWLEKLSGDLNEMTLAGDFPRLKQYERAVYKMEIGEQLTGKILNIGKNNHLSVYIIMLTAFKILLSRLSGQEDISVVSPIYSMENHQYNTFVLLRDSVDLTSTFKELLMAVRQTVIESYKNEHYPFTDLMEMINIPVGASPFKAAMMLETIHENVFLVEIADYFHSDILFSFRENPRNLEANVSYNSRLFKEETIEKLLDRYLQILRQVLNQTGITISEIQWMPPEEKQRILFDFNDTATDYPGGQTIGQLFERQVEKNPDRNALKSTISTVNLYDDSKTVELAVSLDYDDLNNRVDMLAHELRGRGVTADGIVGIMMRHPLEMAVCILAVLKAGGAYVPLDPESPPGANTYILEDSNMQLLVTQQSFIEQLPGAFSSLPIVLTDEDRFVQYEESLPTPANNPSNLAYIIYTSGSTGRPKGTLVEHRGIVNYTSWRIETYNYSPDDVTLQMLSYCFDGFCSNFYSSLLSGGTLVMIPDSKKLDFAYISDVIAREKVTNMSLVPSMYDALIDHVHRDLAGLRFVVLAGDRSSAALVKKSKEKLPNVLLINEYGPTEATVTAAALPGIGESNTTVIGTPISNTRLYILDRSCRPLPVNVPGELFIAGSGLARGYLNNPQLTSGTFIRGGCPVTGGSIYKTGDTARWLENGTVEFLGRADHQVKIRGFRIELDEIECRLLKHHKIKEAVVSAKKTKEDEGGNQYLSAYIIPRGPIDIQEVREFLALELPYYMIPQYFACLAEFPLTPTGKVNRKALGSYEAGEIKKKYVSPRNDNEKKFVDIWQDVLGVEKIGIKDNFFELGGDSLKAIRVISKLNSQGIDITVNEIFSRQTIDEICVGKPPAEETIEKAEPLENYVSENYACNAYYREYQINGNSQPGVLYLLREEFPIHILTKDIKEKFGSRCSLNYIKFIKSEEEIIEEDKIDLTLFSTLMALKNKVSEEDQTEISRELNKNNQLTMFLKRNKQIKRYPVSPIQELWLSGPPAAISQRLLPFSYDFTHIPDLRETRDIVVRLTAKNSLLRSLIVNDNGRYFINEFSSFSNINVPFIDLSHFSFHCREILERQVEQTLQKPISPLDNVPYRLAILKYDIKTFKLIFVFNHLVFDAESSGILEEQTREISRAGTTDAQQAETPQNHTDYDEYVRFMGDLTYKDIRLDMYFDFKHYPGSVEEAHRAFTTGELRRDRFEIDISNVKEELKDYYNEIILLCYARLIGQVFQLKNVPVAIYSNGRNYKSRNFKNTIGLFIDQIPYLFSPGKHSDPKASIERFLNYREQIGNRNLNFINYFMKNNLMNKKTSLRPPFAFNAVIGFYQRFKSEDNTEILKKLKEAPLPGSIFEMMISRDLNSTRLCVVFLQNSRFSGKTLKEEFVTIYNETISDL